MPLKTSRTSVFKRLKCLGIKPASGCWKQYEAAKKTLIAERPLNSFRYRLIIQAITDYLQV